MQLVGDLLLTSSLQNPFGKSYASRNRVSVTRDFHVHDTMKDYDAMKELMWWGLLSCRGCFAGSVLLCFDSER